MEALCAVLAMFGLVIQLQSVLLYIQMCRDRAVRMTGCSPGLDGRWMSLYPRAPPPLGVLAVSGSVGYRPGGVPGVLAGMDLCKSHRERWYSLNFSSRSTFMRAARMLASVSVSLSATLTCASLVPVHSWAGLGVLATG